jgi:poly(hydroxyalkanoate) granule-associated protein
MDEKPDVSGLAKDVETHGRAAAKSMIELTRAVLLSGVGAAGLALDEAKAFLDKLVERGQIAESDARAVMEDIVRRSKHQAEQTRVDTEHQIIDALARLGVPTRSDLTSVDDKITVLSAKIDDLIAARTAAPAEPPVPPAEP